MRQFKYNGIVPKQGSKNKVFGICCKASEVLQFAEIDRIGRTEDGKLRGFQRSQVQSHINEIKNYLQSKDSVLPNSIVIAFTSNVELKEANNGLAAIKISVPNGKKPGFVVDGQQRLSALSSIKNDDFEIFVNCLICEDEDELRRQFILVNNTRPLPRSLIYELLPTVGGLPTRLSQRSEAARLTEMLNFDGRSSLRGQIKQHTFPSGVIQDSVFQKMVMNSLSDGVLREMSNSFNDWLEPAFELISNYFAAVQRVFREDWNGHTPRTSRLVHGAGIISMGFVLEELVTAGNHSSIENFQEKLIVLKPSCSWTSGNWNFGPGEVRKWNDLQVLPKDYLQLSNFLIRNLRNSHSQKSY